MSQNRIEAATPAPAARLDGVDAFRTIAFVAVVLLHTVGGETTPEPDASKIVDLICRFAVPFFFLSSGYFMAGGGLARGTRRTIARVLPIFLAWVAIYLVIRPPHGLFSPLNFLADVMLDGGSGSHLWYLSTLVMDVCLLAGLEMLGGLWTSVIVASGLYLIGLNYGELGDIGELPNVEWNFRDGPFFGLLFLSLGYCFRKKAVRLGVGAALALAGFGLGLQFLEATAVYELHIRGFADDINFYLGTIPYACGVFFLALSLRGPNPLIRRLSSLGKYGLGLYCAHLAVIWGVERFVHPWNFQLKALIAVLTLAATIPLVLAIAKVRILRPLVV